MTTALDRAGALDHQLSELVTLASREDFASHYSEVDKIKELLKKHLSTLRTDTRQLLDMGAATLFAGDPRIENMNRSLIQDIETIGVDIEFEINPKLEIIAKQLVKEVEKKEGSDRGFMETAMDELAKAIELVGSPIAKAAGLAAAIKTLLDFWHAIPK